MVKANQAALMNTNRISIPAASVLGEASKVLDASDHEMTPAERALFRRFANQPEMMLEEAKLPRTETGRLAFGRRSIAPDAKACSRRHTTNLGEVMKGSDQGISGND